MSRRSAWCLFFAAAGTLLAAQLLSVDMSVGEEGAPVISSPENVPAVQVPSPSTPPPTTPTPPPPTPTPSNPCDYYKVTSKKIPGYDLPPQLFVVDDVNSCLAANLNAWIRACKANENVTWDDIDSCLACTAQDRGFNGKKSNHCDDGDNPNGTVYFDASCKNRVENPAGEICSEATTYWRMTPVSLLFGEESLDRRAPAVDFPLDPAVNGKWYMWYASEKAPLLVYDPEGTNRITSGAQLFGNWTFGGKQTAYGSRNAISDASPAGGPWRDGFEALGALDINGDQKLSGSELSALALWFDRNQNGISEPGEVRRLADEGIDALYYGPGKPDHLGNIYIARGYERIAEGQRLTGAAVDWSAERAGNPAELLTGVLSSRAAYEFASQNINQRGAEIRAFAMHGANVAGIWAWKSDDSAAGAQDDPMTGVLAIGRNADGTLRGASLSELRMIPGLKAATAVNTLTFQGTQSVNASGQTEIKFTIVLPQDSRLESSAVLSKDGETLDGKTDAVIALQSGKRTVSYRWTARKQAS